MVTNQFGETYYRLGLHLHTTLSDGKKTPEEVAMEYKAGGYDAVAFTDHWKYGAGGELCGLRILPGAEYNLGGRDTDGCVMHIVGVGMTYDPQLVRENTRQQVIEKYNPGENDLYVRTLELAQISEDDYFGHVVHQDIDGIMEKYGDIERVKRALNHNSVATTTIYALADRLLESKQKEKKKRKK